MKKHLLIPVALLLLGHFSYGACSNNGRFWRQQIDHSRSLETFFMKNYECRNTLYNYLTNSEKLYYDVVLYPRNLKKSQYKNRWFSMSVTSDKEFFKTFSFFNNYFAKHKNALNDQELRCFQKQRGFPYPLKKAELFREINRQGLQNDVSYLYPLIRWSHDIMGQDMSLSRERVEKAEQRFGIQRGRVGDKEQLARYLAVFDSDYDYVANHMAQKMNISYMDAYKLIVILTFMESRGNIFAISNTGAFGPLQLTMHYYMMYGEPNNPFNPRSSLIKMANKFIHYNRLGHGLDASVVAYKSGSLTKCINGEGRGSADCKYYYTYKRLMSEMVGKETKIKVSRYMTGKAYFRQNMKNIKRSHNNYDVKFYEPYQYAVLKGGVLNAQARIGVLKSGKQFKTLGRMKRTDIYELQDRYGVNEIGVISDKKVCY